MSFDVRTKQGERTTDVNVTKICLTVYCGRNTDASRRVLDEKAARGYAVSTKVPNVYRKSRHLLTNENVIEVQGAHTSGEVEYVVIVAKNELLISVGSDHNDRSLGEFWTEGLGKVFDSAKTKQMVPAVVGRGAWVYDEVRDHWDELRLRSYVTVGGKKVLYQDYVLADMVDIEDHFKRNPWLREEGTVIFGGTTPGKAETLPPSLYRFQDSIRGLVFPSDFHVEISDPVISRTISHSYTVQCTGEEG